jgi:hypothetical protein
LKDQAKVCHLEMKTVFCSCFYGTVSHLPSQTEIWGEWKLKNITIDTGYNVPIKQATRRMPVHMQKEVDEHINDMLKRDVIKPSSSPWDSNIVLVKKKGWYYTVLHRLQKVEQCNTER